MQAEERSVLDELRRADTIFRVGKCINCVGIECCQFISVGHSIEFAIGIDVVHLPAVGNLSQTGLAKTGIFVTHHGVHDVGIVNLAANLIGKVCRDVEVLVATCQVEATSQFGLGASYDGHIVGGYIAVTIQILELSHAGESSLSFGQFVGLTTSITSSLVVGNTGLQSPDAILHVEVVDGIDTIRFETLNQTNGLVYLH